MKRFTETDKWRDAWFSELSFKAKLVWTYITDGCDNAGVWDPNKRLAEFSIGTKIEWAEIEKELSAKVVTLPNGKWWIPSFVMFQYGILSPNAQIHRSVLAKLEAHGLLARYQEWLDHRNTKQTNPIAIPCSSHEGGITIPQGTGTVQVRNGTDKDKDSEKAPPVPEQIYALYPRKEAKQAALKAIGIALKKVPAERLIDRVTAYAAAVSRWPVERRQYIPLPASWFNAGRWDDDPAQWEDRSMVGKSPPVQPQFRLIDTEADRQ